MSRALNMLVLDDQVDGTDEVLTTIDLADTLGQADHLVVQVDATGMSGFASRKLKVRLLESNGGRNFIEAAFVESDTITDSSISFMAHFGDSTSLGGLLKLGIAFDSETGSPTGRIKLYACGRTS